MPTPLLIAVLAGAALSLAWVAAVLRFLVISNRIKALVPGPAGSGTVTVVVAAKDEEEGVEASVQSLLAQSAAGLDVVVVDDRSTDRTPAILQRLAAESGGRLQAITVTQLPAGWGGQNHALCTGVRAAKGEWLCFTDADCRFLSPDTVSTALHEAASLDLLSVLPRLEMPTAWERLHTPLCCAVLLTGLRLGEVNDPASRAAYANGAFILVRRSVYDRLGGHERVRGEINDDVALARLAKEAGLRVRVVSNRGLLSTRMYGTVREAWSGWTRNFTGTLKRPLPLLVAATAIGTLGVMPWIGLAATAAAAAADHAFIPAAVAWAACVAVAHAGAALLYAGLGSGPAVSLLLPFGAAFVSGTLLRAAFRTLRGCATVWQGARYESRPAPSK